MASFRKLKTGIRAEVCVNSVRDSRMFDTKAEAKAWAAIRETELRHSGIEPGAGLTVGHVFARYLKDVVPLKRGARWERVRLKKAMDEPLAAVPLSEFKPAHLAAWRDDRLAAVKPSSVRREMVLIGSALEVARREWGWLASNPAREVKKPPESQHRDRLITDDEQQRICWALGWEYGERAELGIQRVAVAFLFAIETAMRAGEICGLMPGDIDGRAARLPITKNGKARMVPLSSRAVELLGFLPETDGKLFGLNSGVLSTYFRRGRLAAGITDVTFHDTRHVAITRLSKVFNPLELARVVGHSNVNQLMTYYNESAQDLAKKLG
jgi:integrase